jgi:hypothetical protein
MVVFGPEEGEEYETKDTTAINWTDYGLTENGNYCDN